MDPVALNDAFDIDSVLRWVEGQSRVLDARVDCSLECFAALLVLASEVRRLREELSGRPFSDARKT